MNGKIAKGQQQWEALAKPSSISLLAIIGTGYVYDSLSLKLR